MANLFGAKVNLAIQRAQQNEGRLLQARQMLQQLEGVRGVAMYRNQRAELQAQIPQLETNYVESLKDLLYELNGYALYCLALVQFGGSCSQQENTDVMNGIMQTGFRLLTLNKRDEIKRALVKSDREFKGVYDYQEFHDKTPEQHADEYLNQIDEVKRQQDRLAEEARAQEELAKRAAAGEFNVGMANLPPNVPAPPANVIANAVANARANAVINAVANARANAVANAVAIPPANVPVNVPANVPANAPANGKAKGKGRGKGKAKA